MFGSGGDRNYEGSNSRGTKRDSTNGQELQDPKLDHLSSRGRSYWRGAYLFRCSWSDGAAWPGTLTHRIPRPRAALPDPASLLKRLQFFCELVDSSYACEAAS